MKANELMIGDWVRFPETNDYGESNVKIICICDDGWGYDFAYVHITGCDNPIGLNEIKPIPLTPDILKKNGYKYRYWWYEQEGYPAIAYVSYGDKYVIGRNLYNCKEKPEFDSVIYIKYAHELQHALKLCGIEKEVVL